MSVFVWRRDVILFFFYYYYYFFYYYYCYYCYFNYYYYYCYYCYYCCCYCEAVRCDLACLYACMRVCLFFCVVRRDVILFYFPYMGFLPACPLVGTTAIGSYHIQVMSLMIPIVMCMT
jgi:hypothetical protein